jgi:DNA polymerase-3 subunit epsilon
MHTRGASVTVYQRTFDDVGTPLADVTFCVIDLETTGGNRATDQITEIGAVKVRGGACLGTFQTLVDPGCAIPPQVAVLTGLTDAAVANAPRIDAVLPSLLEFIGSSVVVGHNVAFDLAFLRRACLETDRSFPDAPTVDTVALARRLVRDEVPNCKLDTLATRLRLDHRPSHRALDDALATTDLLHALLERSAGHGVLGLDDLLAMVKLTGHPQAAKLSLTIDLPRAPGVYLFRGHDGEVLYIGKATNLRQRVRSYFGGDDRRKVSGLLRETRTIDHLVLPDPLTAEVIEQRMIARTLPRYNRKGTRADRYCYVRLDTSTEWPRLSIVRRPSTGRRGAPTDDVHLGPLPSRAVAGLVIEALHTALPIRRCTARLGKRYVPPIDAVACTAAQLGVAMCPCAGTADPVAYRRVVAATRAALDGDVDVVAGLVHSRMATIAAQQRFEEAALVRDRLAALLRAARHHRLGRALVAAGTVTLTDGTHGWEIEHGRLVAAGRQGGALALLPVDPPPPPPTDAPIEPGTIDEVLCLARWIDHRTERLTVRASGPWRFPIDFTDDVPPLHLPAPSAA